MSKRYRPWTPRQSHLLPVSPLDWLPDEHLVYFVLDVVDKLDLSAIEAAIRAKDARGNRPYSPRMMTALLLYAYCVGIFSSRKLARATYEDVPMRVLAGGEHPHFSTVNQFRLQHREALAGLFQQVLGLCRKSGLVKLGHVSLDGTRVQANASKHKAMSYERMSEEDKRLAQEIEQLLAKADAADAEEDELYGAGEDQHDLPEELRRRETRRARIQQAMAELEREAELSRADELDDNAEGQERRSTDELIAEIERKRAATRARQSRQQARKLRGGSDDDDDDDQPRLFPDMPDDLPRHRVPHDPDGKPKPNAQRNFTDPDSRVMAKNRSVIQGYNAQLAVDAEAQVIVAAALTNQAPDNQHLPPMVDRIIENCGEVPKVFTADNGYLGLNNILHCQERGLDVYIAVGREPSTDKSKTPTKPTEASRARDAMRKKVTDKAGREIYKRRKAIVEPPIGHIKQAQGFRKFSLRTIAKASCEWLFVCTTHNLLKLFRRTAATVPNGA